MQKSAILFVILWREIDNSLKHTVFKSVLRTAWTNPVIMEEIPPSRMSEYIEM